MSVHCPFPRAGMDLTYDTLNLTDPVYTDQKVTYLENILKVTNNTKLKSVRCQKILLLLHSMGIIVLVGLCALTMMINDEDFKV